MAQSGPRPGRDIRLSLTNSILTVLGLDGVLGNLTPDDLYPTTIYTLDGDGVADFQQDFTAGGLLDPLWAYSSSTWSTWG